MFFIRTVVPETGSLPRVMWLKVSGEFCGRNLLDIRPIEVCSGRFCGPSLQGSCNPP